MPIVVTTGLIYAGAALAEIVGCFWAWLRQGQSAIWLAAGIPVTDRLRLAADAGAGRACRARLCRLRRRLRCRVAALAVAGRRDGPGPMGSRWGRARTGAAAIILFAPRG